MCSMASSPYPLEFLMIWMGLLIMKPCVEDILFIQGSSYGNF